MPGYNWAGLLTFILYNINCFCFDDLGLECNETMLSAIITTCTIAALNFGGRGSLEEVIQLIKQ